MLLRTAIPLASLMLGLFAVSSCGSAPPNAAVGIHLIAYHPATLDVPVDSTVTWTQRDAGFHTVTSGTSDVETTGIVRTHPDGRFSSGRLATGRRFSFTFSEAGAYRYFCEVHPATMHALVTVK